MAEKNVTFLSVLKAFFTKPLRLQNYLMLTLTFLALGATSVYLNYTDYSFFGILIFIMILIPLVVTFVDYTGRVESGLAQTPTPKSLYFLFANTYKTGRVRLLFSWKTALLFFLYLIVGGALITIIMALYLYFFDPTVYEGIFDLFVVFQNANSPEAINVLYDDFFALIANYNSAIVLMNQIYLVAGLIYVVNRSMFNIYLTMFVEHRPNTSVDTLIDALFKGETTIKKLRKIQFLIALFALILYSAFFIGAYTLFMNLDPAANVMLQAELIGLLVLVVLMPLGARYHFFLYHALVNHKKERILLYIINELKEILKTQGLPEETRIFITQVLVMREEELNQLKPHQADEATNVQGDA